ncbi:3'-5' exonuclease [Sideroxydans lithotrophicus]|uniref:DNA-directed DNA polymerase n=1 Tax=Sideroxydans lithotrophicus (strain ES-1) TaxID=580332 RepID=D5CN31_SIDLE|nr:3'-5' exonuclease [Sideroxydans lithotrophicus]ADE12728.1 DNA polymerase III, epsilon subunit [Sideroxydans lithotrophicus ES-1]
MKKLLQRWFSAGPRLRPHQKARLDAWRAIPANLGPVTFEHSRVVVVDVETTGLNLITDTLISIGAVAVVNGRIALGDSFSVVLKQQESSDKENILVHGISSTAQRDGVDPVEALLTFLEYLGKSRLIAFHVAFDETMIRRAMRQYLGLSFKHEWLDLAYVMPALNRSLMENHRVLDDWIGRFNIHIEARHNALADALATAQLFQIAISQARNKNINDFEGLYDLEKSHRWLRDVS